MADKTREIDEKYMGEALEQARMSFRQGGIPVGAVIVESGNSTTAAEGHNKRVQTGIRILHGEMDCLQKYDVSRQGKKMCGNLRRVTLYTTLNPCMMCAGTIVQFKIPTVVIGQKEVLFPIDKPFRGNIEFLTSHGVKVRLLEDQECEDLFSKFLATEDGKKKWLMDIGED